MNDMVYVGIIIIAIGTVLWCRGHHKKVNKRRKGVRTVDYKEPLVPENFWTSCLSPIAGDRLTLVWIVWDYQAVRGIHDTNQYFISKGIEVIVITPESDITFYDDVPILQFHQRFEIETALRKAKCVCIHGKVVEAAAETCKRARKPLVLFLDEEGQEGAIGVAKKRGATYVVYNSHSLYSEEHHVPHLVVHTPIFWKDYVTHTSRKYITCIGDSPLFYRLVRHFSEHQFMVVIPPNDATAPRLPNLSVVETDAEDLRKIYAETDILCCPFWNSWRSVVEAAMSGIPAISYPTPALKEMLGDTVSWAEEEDAWILRITQIKGNAFVYSELSKRISYAAQKLKPSGDLDRLQVFLEGTV
jgi:glycosyltransferase involved in cell wall biosynthesis